MTWIQTYSGRAFDLLNPRPEDVRLKDIAHGLSRICRFNGHTVTHYSVAEHSVLGSYLVPEDLALAFLLHDAHEAYLGDWTSPLKRAMSAAAASWLLGVERTVSASVCAALGVRVADLSHPDIKLADTVMLKAEADRFFPARPQSWGLEGVPELASTHEARPRGWSASLASAQFLARAAELGLVES